MSQRSSLQQLLSFARPKRKKGGLEIDAYRELVERLRNDANRVAKRFGLPTFELDADRADARDRYGLCFSDGRIRVRLVHVRTGHSLKYSALIDTVVHELAHLRYMDHGPRWEALYQRMLQWCRNEGIYEPGAVVPFRKRSRSTPCPAVAVIEQLSLFGSKELPKTSARCPTAMHQQAELARSVLSTLTTKG
jgi:hypothetical protein